MANSTTPGAPPAPASSHVQVGAAPMSPFHMLALSITHNGRQGLIEAVREGVRPELFDPDPRAKVLFEYLRKYVSEYRVGFPTRDVIMGELGIDIGMLAPAEAQRFLIDKSVQVTLHQQLISLHARMGVQLKGRDALGTFQFLQSELTTLRESGLVASPVRGLFDAAPAVLEYFYKIQRGEFGVPFPWPTLNHVTLGANPEDVILLLARSGVGKTWGLILWALHAFNAGYRVLIVSTELSQETVCSRALALQLQLPYTAFRGAFLDDLDESKLVHSVKSGVVDREGLFFVGGDFDFRVSSLEAAVEDCCPDILLVDGAYLLIPEGRFRDKYDRAGEAYNQTKKLAIRRKIPLGMSTQLNRKAAEETRIMKRVAAKAGKDLDPGESGAALDHIAQADAAGWNASWAIVMDQTVQQKKDNAMYLRFLKTREAAYDKPIKIHWNFGTMEFGQVSPPDIPAPGKGVSAHSNPFAAEPGEHDVETVDVPF